MAPNGSKHRLQRFLIKLLEAVIDASEDGLEAFRDEALSPLTIIVWLKKAGRSLCNRMKKRGVVRSIPLVPLMLSLPVSIPLVWFAAFLGYLLLSSPAVIGVLKSLLSYLERGLQKKRDIAFQERFFLPVGKPSGIHKPMMFFESPTHRTDRFFLLPPELRYHILDLAFGSRTLHMSLNFQCPYYLANIDRYDDPRFGCHAKIERLVTVENSHLQINKSKQWVWFGCVCHRSSCHTSRTARYMDKFGDNNGIISRDSDAPCEPKDDRCLEGVARCKQWPGTWPEKCQIGILGWLLTCRQAYIEGFSVLYGNNTINIASPALLRSIQDVLPQEALFCMTSLELVIDLDRVPLDLTFRTTSKKKAREHPSPLFPSMANLRIAFSRTSRNASSLGLDRNDLHWTEIKKALLGQLFPMIDGFLERVFPSTTDVVISCPSWSWYSAVDLVLIDQQGRATSKAQHSSFQGTKFWRQSPAQEIISPENGNVEALEEGTQSKILRTGFWVHSSERPIYTRSRRANEAPGFHKNHQQIVIHFVIYLRKTTSYIFIVLPSRVYSMPASEAIYSLASPWTTVLALVITYPIIRTIYNRYFHPLAKVPGATAWSASRLPFIFALLRGTIVHDFQDLHRRYGPVLRIAPDEVTFAQPDAFSKIQSGGSDSRASPDSLISAIDPDSHARIRKALAPAFTPRALRSQEHVLYRYVNLLVERLQETVRARPQETDHAVVNMSPWFNFTTFDIFEDLDYGESFDCLENSRYHPWISLLFNSVKAASYVAAARYYPVVEYLLLKCIPASLQKMADDHYRQIVDKVNRRFNWELDRPDIMPHVMKTKDEPDGMTTDQIYSTFMVLTTAGSETTATVLPGTLNYLTRNQDKLRKLELEILGAFQSREEMKLDTLKDLPYLNAVIREGLRLCPPIPWVLPRKVPPSGDTVCGVWLPGGTSVSIQAYTMNRDPHYFHSPTNFVPERWLPEATTGRDSVFFKDQRQSLQPFSVGPRNCMGQHLAMAEMRLILASLVWTFEFQPAGQQLRWEDLRTFLLVEKKPINVRMKLRDPSLRSSAA
ncbi:unnamed protein product [Clonostachys byssicola]|uniref:Uncharacterized protein n=1 Tax=Clonostachys byssicola TaxID=160290 RepID=A0A9N9UA35_9HYPO|nr:unnamed protein product [Clonostachys byssicola]